MRQSLGIFVMLTIACSCAGAKKQGAVVSEHVEVPPGKSASELLSEAQAAWNQRPDPRSVQRAEQLFLAAAQKDPTGYEGLYGAIQAKLWQFDRAQTDASRETLVRTALGAGEACLGRAPDQAACQFGMALALGIDARAHHRSALSDLKKMVGHLRKAQSLDPGFDHGGPGRVLSTVLVRSPGWPLGPGDAKQGLAEAQKVARAFPDYPPNQLALAEALGANNRKQEGLATARHALQLARAEQERGNPDASEWVKQADQQLAAANKK